MRVLILGGNVRVADALLERGHETAILYEAREQAPARDLPHGRISAREVDSYADVDAMIARLGAWRPEAVIAAKEFAVLPAALLAALLGARCMAPEVALRCRYKSVQKEAWRRAGVRTANWTVLPRSDPGFDRFAELLDERGMSAPFVLKPAASAASRNVSTAGDAAEAYALFLKTLPLTTHRGGLILEERNTGDEWHFDGVVRAGAVEHLLVSRYMTPLIETKAGNPTATVSYLPDAEPALYAEAVELTGRATAALGLDDGVFHFELFGGPGRFVAGELAARPGGGWIRKLVRRMLGVDLAIAMARLATGEELEKGDPAEQVYGYTHLPPALGRLNLVTERDIAAIPGVVETLMALEPGAEMPDMSFGSHVKIGMAMAGAPDRAQCAAILRTVLDTVARINGPAGPEGEEQ